MHFRRYQKYPLRMTNMKTLSMPTAEYKPTKQRAKPSVSWETLAVRKKRADVKTVSLCNKRNPTNINPQKLKKAQNELTSVYLKEEREYTRQITKGKFLSLSA